MKEDLQKPQNHNPFNSEQPTNNDPLASERQFIQYPYRWVIVALMGFCLLVNGLGNNTVIPIASKLADLYGISDAYVSAPVIVSFLVYSLTNFPANHIIDTKGLRTSFLIGSCLYMVGIFLYVQVDRGYYFTIFGSILVAIGQPFIINCPAKVATYWFIDKNRTFATAIMTGINFLGTAFGFVLPTLIVHEDSSDEQAKQQIFYLYACQFFISALCFLMVYIFMRKDPPTLPSIGAEQEKSSVLQSLKLIRVNKSLWIFFTGYIVLYGSLLSFGSTANLLFKPYGFGDIQIALFAVVLIIFGVVGSISYSLYIKYTTNYKRAIRLIPTSSLVFMILTCIILNTTHSLPLTFIMVACIGFSFTPLVPISYDLGCEICFPIGQAQVIGILNGGAFIFTFVLTIITTSSVSFQTKNNSLTVLIIYIVLITIGTIIYFFIKIDLKRRQAEKEGHTLERGEDVNYQNREIEMVKNENHHHKDAYENFAQEKHKDEQQQIEI